ncbi:hypothetical protein SO802_027507 [Lithocarpus litseifolius]|uniref:DUF8040 domain-containing protein n=1 Tax=Lithocarpus litseifolius TaxID=425828 RepID=A0AAW2C581_9ROSI
MTIVLQEYTVLARERFNKKTGKSMGSSDRVAQSTSGGDPCSLGRALEVLNLYNDLDDDSYINIFEGRMVSPNDPFWTFDFDDAYFHSDDDDMDSSGCGDDMDVSDCDHDMDIGFNTDSDYDSEEEEFWSVFQLAGEMVAYFQQHYAKRPMRTSILSGKDYMTEVRDGNPTNCHDIGLHGYLKEGKWGVDVQEFVAIFLYIVGHNTRMRLAGDRFQHSIETVSRKFRRVLRAVHTYGQHLIKPDSNVVGLPEHMRSNNK